MNRRKFLKGSRAVAALAVLRSVRAEWEQSQRYPDPLIKIIDASFT